MGIKKSSGPSFSAIDVERRTRKSKFFKDIDQIINWKDVDKLISTYYSKGKNAVGQDAYSGLLLFKMLLVGIWYDLSDERTEEMVNDSLSTMRFCGLRLEDNVPDHSVLSRFRSELTKSSAMDIVLNHINGQLQSKGIMVKGGKAKVDATITDSPRKPKGRKTYEIAEDRKEDQRKQSDRDNEEKQVKVIAVQQPGVDSQGRWVKKGGKLHFGYKAHLGVDTDGLVKGVYTTTANEHDSKGLQPLLERIANQCESIYADKGYKSKANDELIAKHKLKNRVQDKAYRNKPLSARQKLRNKLISKHRYKVERTIGGIKKWFTGGVCRYVGIEKTHTQHVLQAIAYNLKRSPQLVWNKSV